MTVFYAGQMYDDVYRLVITKFEVLEKATAILSTIHRKFYVYSFAMTFFFH